MRTAKLSLGTTLILSILVHAAGHAAIIDGFETAFNDRFANDESFIAAEFDLSGVAINSQNVLAGRWVTMISANVFLSSEHFAPTTGSVTFFQTNDSEGPSLTRGFSNTAQQIGETDLWIGTLDTPLTEDYNFFEFSTTALSNQGQFNNWAFNSANAYFLGKISNEPGAASPATLNMAVGRNQIDGFQSSFSAAGNTGTAIEATYNDSSSANWVEFETVLQRGDSGAPLFVESEGNLVLAGIAWYVLGLDETDDSVPGDATGFTYLGNYTSEINAFLDEHSLPAIPEPAHFTVLLAVCAALLTIRHRRSR
ncbi:MAG: hypothetical protein JJU00_04055 [Opitutales bacterium]|nr:hypothetical protein [Opitutales bacterium]